MEAIERVRNPPATWTCKRHGVVPVNDSYPSDRFWKRYRCKECAKATSKKYLDHAPYTSCWRSFVRRTRRRHPKIKDLKFNPLGREALAKLLAQPAGTVDWSKVKLEYTPQKDADSDIVRAVDITVVIKS